MTLFMKSAFNIFRKKNPRADIILALLSVIISFSATRFARAEENRPDFPSIKIGGYAKINCDWIISSNSTPTYTIPATRIELKAAVSDDVSYNFSMDSAGGGTFKLYDSFIKLSYGRKGLFDARLGQFKYNFSREQSFPDADLELINKSYVVTSLVSPTREIGAEISKNFTALPFKPFIAIGGFNGSGANTPAQNDYGLVTARLVISPMEGFCLGGSYYDGKTGALKTDKKRHGYEICYENRRADGIPLLLRGEYIAGLDGSTDRNGYYLTAGYHIFPVAKWGYPEIMVLARYDFYDTDTRNPDDEISRLTLGTIFQYDKFYSFRLNYEFRGETPSVSDDLLTSQFQVKF